MQLWLPLDSIPLYQYHFVIKPKIVQ